MTLGWPAAAAVVALALAAPAARLHAQRGTPPPAPDTPRAGAAINLTGTWVSVISEDWALRMLTPPRGDYTRLPLTPQARAAADAWDPAAAAGDACRAYGAPAVMRMPGRIRIGWQDEGTMRMDLEAGGQTRLFRFGAVSSVPAPSLQGRSAAEWQYTRVPPRTGELKVTTDRLRAGYLRKNGVPYSAGTTMTEYYHLMTAPNGDVWITLVSEVRDPESLRDPFVQSSHFKKLPDGAAFRPEPCSLQ